MIRGVRPWELLVWIGLLASGWAGRSNATVHTGNNGGLTTSWEFGRFDCGCPPCDISCGIPQVFEFDVWIGRRDFPPRLVIGTPYGGQPLGDVSIFSLTRAPDTGYVSETEILAVDLAGDKPFALKTRDGKYVLFTIYEFEPGYPKFAFVYRYQDNGSILFPAYTTTQSTTWGRLKRLVGE